RETMLLGSRLRTLHPASKVPGRETTPYTRSCGHTPLDEDGERLGGHASPSCPVSQVVAFSALPRASLRKHGVPRRQFMPSGTMSRRLSSRAPSAAIVLRLRHGFQML